MTTILNNINNSFFIPIQKNDKLNIHITVENGEESFLFINAKRYEIKGVLNTFISFNNTTNKDSVAHISFNNNECHKIDFVFILEKNIGTKISYTYEGTFIPNYVENGNYNNGKILNDDKSSFMLLRTNPKITGNIKVVATGDKIYIDTFNINETLSSHKYRHKLVSGQSHYCNDVRNIFKGLSKTELYRIKDENYEIFNTKKELHKQYVDTYFYGAKNNIDKLYTENFSILAPLYIKDTLPDFFLIFKIDGATNKDCSKYTSTERIKYFLENGKIIKTFDLRKDSPLGSYIRNIKSDFENFQNPVYISFDKYIYNEWYGISIDRGIVGGVYESPYDLYKNIKNQVDYDRYITNGFERNGIISSNLINFEFMFDDEESDNLSINRYFGIYVCNNTFDTFYSIDNKIYDKDFNLYDVPEYLITNKRIFNITTEKSDSFKRFYDLPSLREYIKNENNSSYKNVLSTFASYNDEIKDYFMCLNINNPLKSGEHLKVIDKNKKNVYEVILSNVDVNKFNNINDFFDYENEKIVNYYKDNIKIFRNIAGGYNGSYENVLFNTNNLKEIKKIQLKQIVNSFKTILPNTISVSCDDNNIFFSSNDNLTFERISSTFIQSNKKYNNEVDKDITFFNEEIEGVILDLFQTYYDNIYYPLSIPTFGNRIAYIVDFVKMDKTYSLYNISNKTYDNNIDKQILLLREDDNYLPIKNFEINYISTNNFNKKIYKNAIPYLNELNIIGLNTSNTFLDFINLYKPLSFDLNIAGIIPIKDFNFNVLDNNTTIQKKNINGVDIYNKTTIIDEGVEINPIRLDSCENFYNYIKLDCSYKDEEDEAIVNDLYNNQIRKANISLITPTNCKWVLNGKDYINNKIKSTFIGCDSSSYFLNIDNETNFFGFPYDSSKNKNSFYISNDISSIDKELGVSLRDKILYHNGIIDEVIKDGNKYSTMIWNKNSNSLETIIFGQKIKMTNSDIDLSYFNNSLFTIICSPSNIINTSPIEVIFDKKNKKILCVWYYGNGNASLTQKTNYINKKFSNDLCFIKYDTIANLSTIYNNKYIPLVYNNNKNNIKNKNIFINALTLDKNYSDKNKNLTYYFTANYINEYVVGDISSNYIESDNYNLCYDVSTIRNTNNSGDVYIISKSKTDVEDVISPYNFSSFKQIVSNYNINFHIVDFDKTNKYDKLNISFVEPILINDKNFYSYNGYIEPEFIDIFTFEKDEDKNIIGNNLKINLINSNTNIKNVASIEQMWINKVTDDNNYSHPDDTSNALLSFDVIKNFDVTKTCWDDNFFIKYYKDNSIKYINGYEAVKDTKTFFGSHCMVIKDKNITIDNWKNCYNINKNDTRKFNYYNDSNKRNIIELNISKALLNYFSSKEQIKNNWLFTLNASSYANNYIKNLIDSIYDINNKNNIVLFRRPKKSNDIFVSYEENSNFEEVKNIELNLKKVNNEYLLYVELPIDNYEYSIKYTLKK